MDYHRCRLGLWGAAGGGAKGGGASMNKYREGRDGTGIFKNGKCNLKCSGS